MKRVLRFLVCFVVLLAALWLSGYGNLMNDISESLAITSFIGASVVLAIIAFLIWEMYLHFKNKIAVLTKKIEELEEKLK